MFKYLENGYCLDQPRSEQCWFQSTVWMEFASARYQLITFELFDTFAVFMFYTLFPQIRTSCWKLPRPTLLPCVLKQGCPSLPASGPQCFPWFCQVWPWMLPWPVWRLVGLLTHFVLSNPSIFPVIGCSVRAWKRVSLSDSMMKLIM